MARVLLEHLVPGMRLEKPVFNLHGVLLLRTGEILTQRHLDVLKTWRVREAEVVAEDGRHAEAVSDRTPPREVLEAVEAQVIHRFRRARAAEDPIMAEILRVSIRRLGERRMARADPPRLPSREPGMDRESNRNGGGSWR